MSSEHVTPEIERRDVAMPIEYRAESDGRIAGIASVFDTETIIGSAPFGFREQISRTAFNRALERPDDVVALFNHDPNIILGRSTSGTLRLSTTPDGLRYEIDPPETQAAQDVLALIKRGDVTGSSFGFRVEAEEWDEDVPEGTLPLRTITQVELWDVSCVCYPAYPQTSVSARQQAERMQKAVPKRGRVMRSVSEELSRLDGSVEAELSAFTVEPWEDLSVAEQRAIARHYVWGPAYPPERFEDLRGLHHHPKTGRVVEANVTDLLDALTVLEIPADDLAEVRSHLCAHRDAFTEARGRDARDVYRRTIANAREWKDVHE